MLKLERIAPNLTDLLEMDAIPDRVVFQTREWVQFVVESQKGEPVYAAVTDGVCRVGYFTGVIVRRFGLRILGSPLLGWTTPYMGFNLTQNVDKRELLHALVAFAFEDLKCAHVEVRDRYLTFADAEGLGVPLDPFPVWEVDLRPSEEEIFARMKSACRRNIRQAQRLGVTIEEASDFQFAEDYYAQLCDVFTRQGLSPTYGIDRVRKLLERVLPTQRLLILRARDPQGRCIATGLFPAMNKVMYFWGGASWRAYQHLRPNELIFWHAMRYWKAKGVEKFDLGGGGGAYKLKFGPSINSVPSIRKSRFALFAIGRDLLRTYYRFHQRVTGRLQPQKRSRSG